MLRAASSASVSQCAVRELEPSTVGTFSSHCEPSSTSTEQKPSSETLMLFRPERVCARIPGTPPIPVEPPQPEPEAESAAVAAVKPGIPTTAEGLFLHRAGEALKTGKCQNYLLGLQEVIEGTQDKGSRETAYILRARCFDEQLDPAAAAQEYRKYLQRFPAGRFADEARRGSAE